MPILADYHLHSHFSGDSQAPMEDMIRRGIELGLTDMCFTEHMDFDYIVNDELPPGFLEVNTDSYLYELLKYKKKYRDKIDLHFGIELGVQPQIARKLALYAKNYDFDFIIASSHLCGGQDPYYPDFFETRSDEEGYREYFENELACMRSFHNFDVYGHIDYIIRYGRNLDRNYSYDKYKDLFDQMIEHLLSEEKGIELNTGGFNKGLREFHPCSDFLKEYRKRGGEIITIGSDAHKPEALGQHFDKACEVLKDCGFGYYCTFDKRVATYHKL